MSKPIEIVTPPPTKAEIVALKQLAKGVANENQQKVALATIVNKLSRANDLLYVPGAAEGDRATAFLNGRAFVGQRILYYLNKPVGNLTQEEVDKDER